MSSEELGKSLKLQGEQGVSPLQGRR